MINSCHPKFTSKLTFRCKFVKLIPIVKNQITYYLFIFVFLFISDFHNHIIKYNVDYCFQSILIFPTILFNTIQKFALYCIWSSQTNSK